MLYYAENMLKLKGLHFPVKEGKRKKKETRSKIQILSWVERHLIKGCRFQPIFACWGPELIIKRHAVPGCSCTGPATTRLTSIFPPFWRKNSIFKPLCGLASTLTSLLRTKAWEILQRSPDWFWNFGVVFSFSNFVLSLFFLQQAN